ncbi:hypothetical protein [Pseudidiomarina halophila]|nr:hypothetical protein [Pseudidiomarina halophila]
MNLEQQGEMEQTTKVVREFARQLGYLLQHERAGYGLDQTELATQSSKTTKMGRFLCLLEPRLLNRS